MSIELIFTPGSTDNPFELARRRLLRDLAQVWVPRAIGSFPISEDFKAAEVFMLDAAKPMDAFFADIGFIVRDNAPGVLDMTQFDQVVSGAIAGNASYECERAAMMVRGELEEVA